MGAKIHRDRAGVGSQISEMNNTVNRPAAAPPSVRHPSALHLSLTRNTGMMWRGLICHKLQGSWGVSVCCT
jgi:hypothetical protein